jgi:hypothetical protein
MQKYNGYLISKFRDCRGITQNTEISRLRDLDLEFPNSYSLLSSQCQYVIRLIIKTPLPSSSSHALFPFSDDSDSRLVYE